MLWRANHFSRKAAWLVALPFVLCTMILGGLTLSLIPATETQAKAFDFADTAFKAQWQRPDKLVEDGSTLRSWVWGPAFSEGKQEAYTETPGGQRLVQYFDKARMEINNPNAARSDKYFVTNGLLVTDMISGQLQVGEKDFKPNPAGASEIQVAGDPGNGVALTYASFKSVASINGGNRTPDQTGQAATKTLAKDGSADQNPGAADYKVKNAYYEETLGHNIPDVFWTYLNQPGQIYSDNSMHNGLILEWQVAVGLPLTEAYWSRAIVSGQEKDVLVQMFQRRMLTYTPSNAPQWRVEMGNVGQHYYKWRYDKQSSATPSPTTATTPTVQPITTTTAAPTSSTTPVPTTTTVPATTKPATTVAPTATATLPVVPATTAPPPVVIPGGSWNGPLSTQTVARPVVKVNPLDGQVWVVGHNKGSAGIFASSSASNYASVLNLAPGSGGENVQAEFDESGNLHVFWQEGVPNIGLQVFYARVNANGQQAWKRNLGTELANTASGFPDAFYSSVNKRLYFIQEENPGNVVLYESADAGATWTNRTVIAAGNGTATHPRVVADAKGNLHVVWNKISGASEIFAASRIGGNWTNPYNVTRYNGSWNTPGPSLSVDANGDLYLAWIAPGNNTASVGFARYDAAAGQWSARRDNVSSTSPGFGTFKTVGITVSSNGKIWIGFSVDNPNVGNRSGAYYIVSADNGASWSGTGTIFLRDNADASSIYSYGGTVYFVGVYSRQTFLAYRSQ